LFVLSAYQLNWICFVLSPVALMIIFSYSLTKRFTWASHLVLGLALAVAPVGAWLAVVGTPIDMRELAVPLYLGLAVIFWLAGFDIIYALQDREFDRAQGLFSVPVRFGVARSLQISTLCHLCTIGFLAMVGLSAHMGTIYWIGWMAVIGVLAWEHRIVSPNDLSRINRAFFDLNAYVSIAFFCATVADLIVAHAA
jgi:4-hydroxybenzoate polyprenyltransferase